MRKDANRGLPQNVHLVLALGRTGDVPPGNVPVVNGGDVLDDSGHRESIVVRHGQYRITNTTNSENIPDFHLHFAGGVELGINPLCKTDGSID